MGGSSSKVSQLNEIINKVSTDVTMEMASSASGSIAQSQSNVYDFAGTDVGNISALQKAKVSLESIQNATVNAQLQAKLMAGIKAEIDKIKSGLPEITSSKSDTDITNIINNNVSASFGLSAVQSLSCDVSQEMANMVRARGGSIADIKFAQDADCIGKQINSLSSNIANQLVAGTELETSVSEETKNPIAEIADTVGKNITGLIDTIGAQFGLDESTVIMLGLVVIIVVIAGVFGMGGGDNTPIQRQPQMPYMQPQMPYMQPQMPYMQPQMPYMQPQMPYMQPQMPYMQPQMQPQMS